MKTTEKEQIATAINTVYIMQMYRDIFATSDF